MESEMTSSVRIIRMSDTPAARNASSGQALALDQDDDLAVEEPLEIQLGFHQEGLRQKSLAVTMRTPGNDGELAAGFLFTEGIVNSNDQIQDFQTTARNTVLVTLQEHVSPVLQKAARNFYTTSSCGVCGKASIDAISTVSSFEPTQDSIRIDRSIFYHLQNSLSQQQEAFARTGGLHAAALFGLDGNYLGLREDVGRHNALDKLIGHAYISNKLPLSNHILLLSGRASFELIQKASMAGIKIVAAIGAPSTLAVELANKFGITLIGFLRQSHFNIYSGSQRIKGS